MIKLLLSSACALALCACSAFTPIPKPEKSWAQHTGQIQTIGGTMGIVGEISIRSDANNFLAEISKGPGVRLLTIYAHGAHGEEILVRGPLAGSAYQGSAANAHGRLQSWAALPDVFHWAAAHARGDWKFTTRLPGIESIARSKAGRMESFEFTRGGETITCKLNQ